jgi:hypothetical protein
VVGASLLYEVGTDLLAEIEQVIKGLRGGFDLEQLGKAALSALVSAATVLGAIIPGSQAFTKGATNLLTGLNFSKEFANSFSHISTEILSEGAGEVLGGLLASGLVSGQWTVGVMDLTSGLAEGAGEVAAAGAGKRANKALLNKGINVSSFFHSSPTGRAPEYRGRGVGAGFDR